MPIFEYRCKHCDNEFETLVMGQERAKCPSCSSVELERLLSTFAAVTGTRSAASAEPLGGSCGSCGDPRGPGACKMG